MMMRTNWGTVGVTTLALLFAAGAYPGHAQQVIAIAAWVVGVARSGLGKYGTWFDYLIVYAVLIVVAMVSLGVFVSLRQAVKKVL